MNKFFFIIIMTIFSSLAGAQDINVRSIEKSALDIRCLFNDFEGTEKKFALELSRDHKSLRVFLLDHTSHYEKKIFLGRLNRYNHSNSSTHVSMGFQNPNQRGNILYIALGVPLNVSILRGEQAQHAVIHFSEGLYLTGRCHISFI